MPWSRVSEVVGARSVLVAACTVLVAACTVLVAACGGGADASGGPSSGRLRVVAAEDFWGSIAAQLGGGRVWVQSIIVNPSTDPHAYEPTASDAIALARSRLAIVNGIGYDAWASRLLAADPSDARRVLDAGRLLHLTEGENPHQWYAPASVARVVDRIAADYTRLDPAHAAYYARRRARFETRDLAGYHRLMASIRRRYAGVAVGYSETVFTPLGRALGLTLLTPSSFARAISEGGDVSAADIETVDAQVRDHRIRVWVYNSQNATPDVQRVNALARAAHIPVTTITETLSPASDTFEQWQTAELRSLQRALHQATGQ